MPRFYEQVPLWAVMLPWVLLLTSNAAWIWHTRQDRARTTASNASSMPD